MSGQIRAAVLRGAEAFCNDHRKKTYAGFADLAILSLLFVVNIIAAGRENRPAPSPARLTTALAQLNPCAITSC